MEECGGTITENAGSNPVSCSGTETSRLDTHACNLVDGGNDDCEG